MMAADCDGWALMMAADCLPHQVLGTSVDRVGPSVRAAHCGSSDRARACTCSSRRPLSPRRYAPPVLRQVVRMILLSSRRKSVGVCGYLPQELWLSVFRHMHRDWVRASLARRRLGRRRRPHAIAHHGASLPVHRCVSRARRVGRRRRSTCSIVASLWGSRPRPHVTSCSLRIGSRHSKGRRRGRTRWEMQMGHRRLGRPRLISAFRFNFLRSPTKSHKCLMRQCYSLTVSGLEASLSDKGTVSLSPAHSCERCARVRTENSKKVTLARARFAQRMFTWSRRPASTLRLPDRRHWRHCRSRSPRETPLPSAHVHRHRSA